MSDTRNSGDAELLDYGDMRRSYDRGALRRTDLGDDPTAVLGRWVVDATAAGELEPNAMVIATADATGVPSARTVLLKNLDRQGLRFFTNRESQKGRELAVNPHAAACFVWHTLHRQVRVVGAVEPTDDETSDAYFARRPRGSRIAAWASRQSQPIDGREALEACFRETEERFTDLPVGRPPYWGGYLLRPASFEFWQGRPSRLHDRLVFERAPATGAAAAGGSWTVRRLAP